jgi:hypothetical protein
MNYSSDRTHRMPGHKFMHLFHARAVTIGQALKVSEALRTRSAAAAMPRALLTLVTESHCGHSYSHSHHPNYTGSQTVTSCDRSSCITEV